MDGFWPTFIRRKPTPPSYSEKTWGKSSGSFLSPRVTVIPLQETAAAPYQCFVKRGQEVTAGEKIGSSGEAPFALAVHAGISGKVQETDFFATPDGFEAFSVVIEGTGEKEIRLLDDKENSADGLVGLFLEAGIPLDYQRLGTGKITLALVNATEFDPLITVHHQLILEKSQEIIAGLKALTEAFAIPEAVILVENHLPTLRQALEKARNGWQSLTILETKKSFPTTADNLLVQEAAPKRRRDGKPEALVIELALLVAMAQAREKRMPLISRMITCAGSGIPHPQNLWVRVGTPFGEIIEYCGGELDNVTQIVRGGLLMGTAQISPQVAVTKKTSGILALVSFALEGGHQSRIYEQGPCVRCAKCVDSCPASLLPNLIAAYCQKKRFDEAKEAGLFLCVDCGLCSYVCPARIPLASLFKEAKSRELKLSEESS